MSTDPLIILSELSRYIMKQSKSTACPLLSNIPDHSLSIHSNTVLFLTKPKENVLIQYLPKVTQQPFSR